MGELPYRPPPPQDDEELVQLAAKGRHRIVEAVERRADAEEKRAEQNLRVALGRHYGSPVRRLSTALIVLSAVTFFGWIALALVHDEYLRTPPLAYERSALGWIVAASFHIGSYWWVVPITPMVFTAAMLLRFGVAPAATRARVAAEQSWVSSLPFPIGNGYFAALSAEPVFACRLCIEIAWAREPVALDLVQGILGVIDSNAVASAMEGGDAIGIRTGVISGGTGVSVSHGGTFRSIVSNHGIVAYVHRLVDEVLVPLHRRHSIARVVLRRDS